MNPYASLSDDFGLYAYLNTKMELPTQRETVLHFFDSLQKTFPSMTEFDKRETGEYVLEEDRELGSYRMVSLDSKRFCTGFINPPDLEDADAQHQRILDIAPFHLDLTSLNCEELAVLYSFDYLYSGNHDEVVAEALGRPSPFEGLMGMDRGRVINYEPSIIIALDESCRLQCRVSIETRTSAYQIRTGQYPEAPISVYMTIRQFWGKQKFKTFFESYQNQRRVGEELLDQHIVPNILRPLAQAIAARQ